MSWRRRYVTEYELDRAVGEINERMDQMEASQQGQLDALTATVGTIATDLAVARTKLQSEIDALATTHPQLDLSGLSAAVAPLDQAVQSLGDLTPTPPAPTA